MPRLTKIFTKAVSVAVSVITVACLLRTFVVVHMSHRELSKCSKVEGDQYIELNEVRWERLKQSLHYRTISYSHNHQETNELRNLVTYLIEAHPTVFTSDIVSYEIVNNYSLLIHVQGRNSDLLPYLIAGHLDVVPVTESLWSVPPFLAVEDPEMTKVFGRGTLDDKGSILAQLSALEFLLRRAVVPERSFYLAYGHDEEVLGINGAGFIAKKLRSKGINNLHFVLDEGLVVVTELIPGMEIALIGVSEKGYVDLNVSVEIQGGHSSMPFKETALQVLAGAVSRLQSNPMPGEMDELTTTMLEEFAPSAGFPLNIILSNLWLFKRAISWVMQNEKTAQGAVRTTTAVTVMRAGTKNNVIPSSAWAIVNHRIHPKDTLQEVLEYDRRVINDPRVKVDVLQSSKPHPIAPHQRSSSLAYQVLTDSVSQIYENAVVAPGILVATTDTFHYLDFTKNVYRFNPVALGKKEIASIHAEDEYISKDNFQRMINFYYHVMRNADRTELRDIFDIKEEL